MEIALIVAVAVVAIGFVAYPLLAGGDKDVTVFTEEALNEQVARYREAIQRGTLCERCLSANAPASKFCGECGRALN